MASKDAVVRRVLIWLGVLGLGFSIAVHVTGCARHKLPPRLQQALSDAPHGCFSWAADAEGKPLVVGVRGETAYVEGGGAQPVGNIRHGRIAVGGRGMGFVAGRVLMFGGNVAYSIRGDHVLVDDWLNLRIPFTAGCSVEQAGLAAATLMVLVQAPPSQLK